jgi:hypothetical protein
MSEIESEGSGLLALMFGAIMGCLMGVFGTLLVVWLI